MSEEEQVQEQTQEVSQNIEQAPEMAVETTEKAQEEQKQEKVVKDKEYNFAELRKAKEAAERERDYERQRYSEMLELVKVAKQPQTQQERDLLEEEISKLAQDDLATVGNTAKIVAHHSKPAQKKMSAMEEKIAALEAKLEEQDIRVKFPDVDQVLSSENIALLNKEDPEIAAVIGSLPKGSRQQITMAYKYIKKLVPQAPLENTERKIAEANLAKPRSIQSAKATSPIGQANLFANLSPDKETKSAIYKQMLEDMKRG